MLDRVLNFFKRNASFTRLAEISTPRKTWFYGLFPPITTLVVLLGISLTIAGGVWLGGFLWAGALAGTMGFIPILEVTIVSVLGLAFFNFWFSRGITDVMLSSRAATSATPYAADENPTDVVRMTETIIAEVNAFFKQSDPNFQKINGISLYTFSSPEPKVVVVEGRNRGKAGIFISDKAFSPNFTKMNQRQLAAWIQMGVIRIYLRRGFSRTLVGVCTDLLSMLKNLNNGNVFFQTL